MSVLIARFLVDDQGQDIAEYAVMLAVILVLVVGTIRLVGSNANNAFSAAASAIQYIGEGEWAWYKEPAIAFDRFVSLKRLPMEGPAAAVRPRGEVVGFRELRLHRRKLCASVLAFCCVLPAPRSSSDSPRTTRHGKT